MTKFSLHEYYHSFTIADPKYLDQYKLLKWDASYFLNNWHNMAGTKLAGTIQRYMHIYHVQFCKGCSYDKIRIALAANPETKLALSFRKAAGLPAYVLVDFTSTGAGNGTWEQAQ